MKKTVLLFCLIAFVAAAAFQNKPSGSGFRIKKVISLLRQGDTTSYTYTAEGKIASCIKTAPATWQNFTYQKDMVIEEGSGIMKGTTYKNTFYLNKSGLMDSMMRMVDTMPFCVQFKYDKNGFKVADFSGCGETKTIEAEKIIANGNIGKQLFYINGKQEESIVYDYYTDKPNQPTMFGEATMGYTFRGSDSKNLLKSLTMITGKTDTLLVNTHKYNFDDKGRITTHVIYNKAGGVADSVMYVY